MKSSAAAFLLLSLMAASFGLAPRAQAANIGVSPVVVRIDEANDKATLSVVNSGSDPVVMQVEAVSWRRDASGDDQDFSTSDLVINPLVFTLQAGQTQVVRVAMRRAAAPPSGTAYRVVMREVPSTVPGGDPLMSGQVRILMAVRVPVYVSPAKVVRQAQLQAVQQADGQVVARIRNEGNVHMRIGRLDFQSEQGASLPGGQALAGPGAVVFPGEERSIRLRALGRPAVLEMVTDQGTVQVPVTIAQNEP